MAGITAWDHTLQCPLLQRTTLAMHAHRLPPLHTTAAQPPETHAKTSKGWVEFIFSSTIDHGRTAPSLHQEGLQGSRAGTTG